MMTRGLLNSQISRRERERVHEFRYLIASTEAMHDESIFKYALDIIVLHKPQ